MNAVMLSLVGAVLVSGCVSAPAPTTYYAAPAREPTLCESFGTLATTIAEAQQAGVPRQLLVQTIVTKNSGSAELRKLIKTVIDGAYDNPDITLDAEAFGRMNKAICVRHWR
jgi:hypothetical protein